jgi:hypothetical protein
MVNYLQSAKKEKRKYFFFEKKKQKPFTLCAKPPVRMGESREARNK